MVSQLFFLKNITKIGKLVSYVIMLCSFLSCYEPPTMLSEEDTENKNDKETNGESGESIYESAVSFNRFPEVGEGYGGFVVVDKVELSDSLCHAIVMSVKSWYNVDVEEVDSILSGCRISKIKDWRLLLKDEVKFVKSNVLYCGLQRLNQTITDASGDIISEEHYYYCLDKEGIYKRFTFASGNVLSVASGKRYHLRAFADIYIALSSQGYEWGDFSEDEISDNPGGFGDPDISQEQDWDNVK